MIPPAQPTSASGPRTHPRRRRPPRPRRSAALPKVPASRRIPYAARLTARSCRAPACGARQLAAAFGDASGGTVHRAGPCCAPAAAVGTRCVAVQFDRAGLRPGRRSAPVQRRPTGCPSLGHPARITLAGGAATLNTVQSRRVGLGSRRGRHARLVGSLARHVALLVRCPSCGSAAGQAISPHVLYISSLRLPGQPGAWFF